MEEVEITLDKEMITNPDSSRVISPIGTDIVPEINAGDKVIVSKIAIRPAKVTASEAVQTVVAIKKPTPISLSARQIQNSQDGENLTKSIEKVGEGATTLVLDNADLIKEKRFLNERDKAIHEHEIGKAEKAIKEAEDEEKERIAEEEAAKRGDKITEMITPDEVLQIGDLAPASILSKEDLEEINSKDLSDVKQEVELKEDETLDIDTEEENKEDLEEEQDQEQDL